MRRRPTLPLVDPHAHLAAEGRALRGVDCRRTGWKSEPELLAGIEELDRTWPIGRWIEIWGYDPAVCTTPVAEEKIDARFPSRPVVLRHTSLHAALLNGAARRELGLGGRAAWFYGGHLRIPGKAGCWRVDVRRALARRRLLGWQAVGDATPITERPKLEEAVTYRAWTGAWAPAVRWMISPSLAVDLHEGDLSPGERSLISGVKIFADGDSNAVHSVVELTERVDAAHRAGFPACVHAIDEDAIWRVLMAFEQSMGGLDHGRHRCQDRIEHAAVCPPLFYTELRRLECWVVTQPAFIAQNGDRYLKEVPADRLDWLYPIGGLVRSGVRVALSSDAPAGPYAPGWLARAAMERKTRSGIVLGSAHALTACEVRRLFRRAWWVFSEE